MAQVNITEFRRNMPRYLRQVQKGAEIRITSHGETIARLVPDSDGLEQARARLIKLRGTMLRGDVMSPTGEEWGGDADNL